jgi:hypothetical protein
MLMRDHSTISPEASPKETREMSDNLFPVPEE